MKRYFKENNKGITLISLIITIVVMLILAVVSVNVLNGDNGIIEKANKAKTEWEIASKEENVLLDELFNSFGQMTHTHNWSLESRTLEPTCTEPGADAYICWDCLSTKLEEVPPEHDWITLYIVSPTCQEDGETVYICENVGCDASKTEIMPAIEHAESTYLQYSQSVNYTTEHIVSTKLLCCDTTIHFETEAHDMVNGTCSKCGYTKK